MAGRAGGFSLVGVKDFLDSFGLTNVRLLNLNVGRRGRRMNAKQVFHDVDGAVNG